MDMIKRKFMGMGIARKILILLLTVSLIPLIGTLGMYYRLSRSAISAQTNELIQANLEQAASNVQNFWQTYEDIIQSIYIDDFYGERLEPINRWERGRYHFAKAEIMERLENIVYTNEEILGILIMGANYDTCFYDSVTGSGQISFCFDVSKIRYNKYVKEAMRDDRIVYSSMQHISDREYGDRDILYIACQLRNFGDIKAEPMGCVIICVDEQALQDVYGKSNTRSNITLVTNQYGDIISFPQESLAGVNILSEADRKGLTQGEASEQRKSADKEKLEQAAIQYLKENKYLAGEKQEAVSKSISEGKCYVINVRNPDYAMRSFRYIVEVILLFAVLVGLLCVLIAIGFSKQVDSSVQPILLAMGQVNKGDLTVRSEVQGDDEFSRISSHFNHMIEQIHISNEQERDALIREKNAEIKALEAQINPHFLYNTLDAINWVAIDRQEYTISRMLASLATILRYSIHKSSEVVPIQSELEYLRKYVYLQQQRFDYSFLCTIDADEAILDYKIHKLLIQPLMENTLVHGFPGKGDMDEINIRIHKAQKGTQIVITVEDNGVGMDRESVELFNRFDYRKERIESSIGVRNVITRLKMYYGEQSCFHMESGEDGTRITMKIPYTCETDSENSKHL